MKTTMTKISAALFTMALSATAWAASDGGVITTLRTANDLEIEAGQVAKKKALNSDVKAFADNMVNAHKDNKKETDSLVKKHNIKPESTKEATLMKSDESAKIKSWKSVSGADFDKAYMANQIDMHKALLNQLDSDYIPNARNTDLKAHLEKTRAHVQEHLTRAEEINTAISAQ